MSKLESASTSVTSVCDTNLDLPYERYPRNWSTARRWCIAIVIWNLIAPIDMSVTLYSGAQDQIKSEFGTDHFVVALGVGLVNLGFSIGPLIAAPLSELYGRRLVYIGSAIAFTLFSMGSAISKSITALLVTRFFAGFLGSAVFSNFGGSLSDLFTPDERGPLVAVSAFILQGAPTIGPVPGNFMGQYVSWRWVLGLISIWGALVTMAILFLPETEISAIKRNFKKQRSSHIPQNTKIKPKRPGTTIWRNAMLMPLTILVTEPIVAATSLYHSFIYGILFILLEVYPYIFKKTYGFTLSQSGLVFLSPWMGNALGVCLYFGHFWPSYIKQKRQLQSFSGITVELKPEARLPGVLFSACLVPIGLFWFSFTCSHPSVHWIVPILSGLPIGAGMTLLQLSLSNYYIDLYPTLSASALAANVFLRCGLATWFPTFAIPMYERLGMQNAGLLLSAISLLGIPGGWILWRFGSKLRAMSTRAVQDEGRRGLN